MIRVDRDDADCICRALGEGFCYPGLSCSSARCCNDFPRNQWSNPRLPLAAPNYRTFPPSCGQPSGVALPLLQQTWGSLRRP